MQAFAERNAGNLFLFYQKEMMDKKLISKKILASFVLSGKAQHG
jgi:hypothetical protein